MKKVLIIIVVILFSGCFLGDAYKKSVEKLQSIEKSAGKYFCVAAKKFVPMGASEMAKQFDCKKAQECLQALPVINKCYEQPKGLNYVDARSSGVMAIAGAICAPAVVILATYGSKKVAKECSCDEKKLYDKMIQAEAICAFVK